MLLALIAGCEIAFWVTLAAGLAFRYGLRWRRTGMVFLALTPTVDLVLLVAGGIDLARGGEPSYHHSLAAIFLGCSVTFGHRMIRWADGWAGHWLAGAPRPTKPPKGSSERVRAERHGWYLHAGAYFIGCALMLAGGLMAGDPGALLAPVHTWTIVLVVDAVFSFSSSPKPASSTR